MKKVCGISSEFCSGFLILFFEFLDVPEIINHLTNSNDGMMDTIQVKVNDNIRKRRLSKCEENIETMTKMCRTITVLEEETLENSDKIDLLETTSTHNSLFGSPLSSRRNSADSIISAVSTEINDTIVEPMTSTVLVEDINESTIVESINNSTLVESITQEPSLKEKKATSGSSSKVEKQTLKRSSKDKKESSRQSSIESSSKEKKDKKNLVQSKLCFTKQIDDKKGTVVTSTPLKNLRRSSRSESTSSTNKNEMIRFDYLKDKTPVKDVKHSTDFCKAMEELNVIKKTKKSKLVVNDVKPISTARAQRSRSRNRSRCEDNLESITKDIPLPAEQKPVVSKVKKVEKKSKESTLKSVVEKGLNKTNEIIKETSEKLSPKLKKERKSVAPLQQVLTPPIFATEVLEKAIEKLVPYDEILTVLRYASHVTTGRPTLQEKAAIERKRNETKKLLGKLKYFHCGNCQKDVTKQKWKDHLLNHGGLAWIDGFEKAIDLNDWEGSLRRFVNNMKIYKIPAFVCPLCSEERKSALGQLSHVILCGFDEETVEGRKKKCSTCDATMYPFNYAYHKKTCIGRVVLQSEVEAEEIEDEPVTNVLDSSGRVKRKAVQK